MQKLQIGKRGQKTELTGRSPLREQRFALDCSAVEEEEEEEEEEVPWCFGSLKRPDHVVLIWSLFYILFSHIFFQFSLLHLS
jgi:hypothetical protein